MKVERQSSIFTIQPPAEAGIRKAQEEQKVVEAGIQKAVEERMAAQARCEAIIRKAEAVKAVKALGKKRRREEMAESSITRANMERPLLGPDCFLSGGCPQMIKFNKTANLTVQCCEVSNPQTLKHSLVGALGGTHTNSQKFGVIQPRCVPESPSVGPVKSTWSCSAVAPVS